MFFKDLSEIRRECDERESLAGLTVEWEGASPLAETAGESSAVFPGGNCPPCRGKVPEELERCNQGKLGSEIKKEARLPLPTEARFCS